jgi:hypothetical protein
MMVLRRNILFSELGFREEIEIERIIKDEVLEVPVSPHTEGDIMVIWIVEEVREPRGVKLRREEVLVDRDTQNRDDQ